MKDINDIAIEYSVKFGGGLPLTAKEYCNAVALWTQSYVEEEVNNTLVEASKVTVERLSTLIEGSETIVVDISEDNQKLEIHLDYEVVQKLDRAILTPVNPLPQALLLLYNGQTKDYNFVPVQDVVPDNSNFYNNIIYIKVQLGGLDETVYIVLPNYITSNTPFPANIINSFSGILSIFTKLGVPDVSGVFYNLPVTIIDEQGYFVGHTLVGLNRYNAEPTIYGFPYVRNSLTTVHGYAGGSATFISCSVNSNLIGSL